jgi:hypothetical protein
MAIYKVSITTSVSGDTEDQIYREAISVRLMESDDIPMYFDPRLDVVFSKITKDREMIRTVLVQPDDTGIPNPGPEELLIETKVALDMGKKLIKEHLGIKSNNLYFLRG